MSKENKLYYLGHASLRITTSEGKVIYIDPYEGNNYDIPANLVLITHDHYDHSDLSKITKKADDYRLITSKEALKDGTYQKYDLGYVKVEAVEAGNNEFHDIKKCVGYVLTLSSGTKLYVAGDTYLTSDMEKLEFENIDYAFLPCDGIYTMNTLDAEKAAKLIKAKHTIPYHTTGAKSAFDENVANKLNVENKLIIRPNEEIVLE